MIRAIVQSPDVRLQLVAAPIGAIDHGIRALCGDMLDTMRKHKGMGLAAPQVGAPVRVIVVNPASGCPFSVMINPRIISRSPEQEVGPEGCLSIERGVPRYPVERSKGIRVSFQDRAGASRELQLAGLAARVVQHEVDHLDGVMITQRTA